MSVETPVTIGGLIIASAFLLVVNFAPRLYDWLKLRAEIKERERQAAREAETKAAQIENEKDDKVFDRVVTEYERQIERGNRLERELEQLRPLAIENAVMKQRLQLATEDKEDWKHHALLLEQQLRDNNVIPALFRRLHREGDTHEKIKTVSRKMKTIKDSNGNAEPSGGSPTIIFPAEGENK